MIESMIPFNSEIKFTMFIRDIEDMQESSKLMVLMKGAPERVLSRCSKILIQGKAVDFTDELRDQVNMVNNLLGQMGERVLAIAQYKLEPEVYTKDPPYPFDVKGWKNWQALSQEEA